MASSSFHPAPGCENGHFFVRTALPVDPFPKRISLSFAARYRNTKAGARFVRPFGPINRGRNAFVQFDDGEPCLILYFESDAQLRRQVE